MNKGILAGLSALLIIVTGVFISACKAQPGVEDNLIEAVNTGFIKDDEYEGNSNIRYPVVLKSEHADKINLRVKEFIKDIVSNDLFQNLELDYEISFLSEEKLSILFNGRFDFGVLEKFLVKSLNFDLKTGREITYENYFDDGKESQDKLLNLLQKAALEQVGVEFEAEGRQIYFKGTDVVVFYFPLDDSVKYPLYLYLAYEDIEGLKKIVK